MDGIKKKTLYRFLVERRYQSIYLREVPECVCPENGNTGGGWRGWTIIIPSVF